MLWRPLLQFHADVHVDLRVHPNVLMFSPLISYLQQFCTFITRSKSNVSYLSPVLRSNISWSSSKTVSFMNPLHMYHHPADTRLHPAFLLLMSEFLFEDFRSRLLPLPPFDHPAAPPPLLLRHPYVAPKIPRVPFSAAPSCPVDPDHFFFSFPSDKSPFYDLFPRRFQYGFDGLDVPRGPKGPQA